MSPPPPFPLTLEGVTLRIERIRADAGRDGARLAALARELELQLREALPEEPFLADLAREVLGSYCRLARHGFFPEVRGGDEDL